MTQVATYPSAKRRAGPVSEGRAKTGQPWLTGGMLLAAVMLLTIFEGAGRKWLFEEYPFLRYAAYFSKDLVFMLAAYWGLRRGRRFDLSWMVLCGLLIVAPSAVSTMANSNVVGMGLSFRAYLVIPACAFLVAPLVRGFQDVERCALAVALVSVLVAALGAYQYTLPATHVLNRYDSGTEESHGTGAAGYTRATGTFSYIGGMQTMAGISAWAGMLLVFRVPGRRDWVRVAGALALAAGLLCAAVTMSRGALLMWCVIVAGGLMLYLRANQLFLLGLAIFGLIAAFATSNPLENLDTLAERDSLATGLAYRIQHSSDSFASRLNSTVSHLMDGVTNHPLGEGMGLGQPGGFYATYGVRTSGGYESEWGRIAFEVGPPGLLGVLLIRFGTGLICWRALRQTADIHRRLVLATALPFFGIMSVGGMAFNHVGNSAAWAAMALALAAVPAANRRSRTVGAAI